MDSDRKNLKARRRKALARLFGKWFDDQLGRARATHEDFAETMRCSTTSVSNWVSGEFVPHPANFNAIVRCLQEKYRQQIDGQAAWQELWEKAEQTVTTRERLAASPIERPAVRSRAVPAASVVAAAVLQKVGRNSSGCEESRIEHINLEFIRIPAGQFWMGSPIGEGDENECPRRRVHLDEYHIGKYPVTNAQFYRFVQARKYVTEVERWGRAYVLSRAGEWVYSEGVSWRSCFRRGREHHPVVCISPADAQEFCAWVGARLPTEAEWEKAARGVRGWKFPWGDAPPSKEQANFGMIHRGTTPVTEFPRGVSPFGCFDMAGNTWEWCADEFDEHAYRRQSGRNPWLPPHAGGKRVNRGGAWCTDAYSLRCAYRDGDDTVGYFHVGFRCALSCAIR